MELGIIKCFGHRVVKNAFELKAVLMLLFAGMQFIAAVPKNEKAHFIHRLDNGEQVTIVTLGTSLTGGEWRWVDVMMEWLNKDYPGQVEIHNLGVGASASMTVPAMEGNKYIWNKCGLDRISETIDINPDVVFIEFAVNDAYRPYAISVKQSQQNLELMIRDLKVSDPNIEVILQTMNVVIDMPEMNMFEATRRADLPKYVKMYKRVAKKYNLTWIDHYRNWKKYLKNEGRKAYIELVPDGIHPNPEGYRKILLPELKNKLQGGKKNTNTAQLLGTACHLKLN